MITMNTICLVLCLAVLGILVLFLCKKKKEKYSTTTNMNLNSVANIGSLTNSPQPRPYEMLDEQFANVVSPSCGKGVKENFHKDEEVAMQRLNRDSRFPRISKDVTPFNVDVSDPSTYSFSVSMPRVQLKSKSQDYSAASMMRGDIPITYHDEICMVTRPQYMSADNLKMDGFFSDTYRAKYNKLTGAGYRNHNAFISNEEIIMS